MSSPDAALIAKGQANVKAGLEALDKEGVAGLEREVRRMFPEGQDPSPVEDPESSSGHVTLLLDPFRDPPPIREPNPPDPLEELWADFERLIQPGARK